MEDTTTPVEENDVSTVHPAKEETVAVAVTRPARKRTTVAKQPVSTPPKKAKAATRVPAVRHITKSAPAALVPAAPVVDDTLVRIPMVLEWSGESKNYAIFRPLTDSGCTGSLYVPLGTTQVRVLLISPNE